MPPKTLVNLLRATPIRILPEQDLVEQFVEENLLDLSKTYSEAELKRSNADEFVECRSNLVINRIYAVKVEKNKLVMQKHIPSELFRREYPMTERYFRNHA